MTIPLVFGHELLGWLPSPIEAISTGLQVFGWCVVTYFVVINTSFLLLVGLAVTELVRHVRRTAFQGHAEAFASPLTPPVSVIMPAYNEAPGIVEAVRAMSSLRYPQYEIIVVDDGSTDRTFQVLSDEFDLIEVPRVIDPRVPTRGRVHSVHAARRGIVPLVVVRKDNGGKADSLNTGVNLARHPLVCMVDADSLLDGDALLYVVQPFVEDPDRVVATGGVVRPANGCRVEDGRVVDVRMPRGWLQPIQVVEYLRSFIVGRSGWSRFGSLLVISGAFGMFRRDVLIEVGGLALDCIGEDAELVVRIHRRLREQRRDYRVVFVPAPVSWTEVPHGPAVLARQRRRWHRGIREILGRHRGMILNPRYGKVGMVTMPWFVLFELVAPFLELMGLGWLLLLVLLRVLRVMGLDVVPVDLTVAWLFLAVAFGYASLLTLTSVAAEEYAFHRYQSWSDLVWASVASVVESFGYRQLTAWWRVQGTVQALRGSRQVWGAMPRTGFSGARIAASAAVAPRGLP